MTLMGQNLGVRPRPAVTADNPLLTKLEGHGALGEGERRALSEAIAHPRRLAAGEDLIHAESPAGGLVVVLGGFASRARLLADGRRQVLAYLVPGDTCPIQRAQMRSLEQSIVATTPMMIGHIGRDALTTLCAGRPRFAEAFRWSRSVDEAISQEWLVNLGQRTAFERTAALLSEFYMRLAAAGQARDGSCDFPFTQTELAETLGLSAVHINRTLQELRRVGLIKLADRRLTIPCLDALFAAGVYDPAYLRRH